MNLVQIETATSIQEISQTTGSESLSLVLEESTPPVSKAAIRTSLKASTWDGVFAAVFSNIAGGVLLSNFLVEQHATSVQIGMLASIPMLVNLIQPIGAHLSNRTTSRHRYCLWIYGLSRLMWLILVGGIGLACWGYLESQQLVFWTLGIVLASHLLGALGSASWLSWLAMLVPQRLRGRYFGVRNSAASLTTLASVPLAGLLVSKWPGGSLEGYGLVLLFGVIAGIVSLGFQYLIVDVNPQGQQLNPSRLIQKLTASASRPARSLPTNPPTAPISPNLPIEPELSLLKDPNFLTFLLYFGFWMFAVNLSAPFFTLYMLDDLGLDVSWVTLYGSLTAGANLLLLMLWGKVADRIGNRPVLILVGFLVALTPLLWLVAGTDRLSLWLWLPLLHLLTGATWAAIDLGNNNLQIDIAPIRQQATYFAIAAAVAGVGGALGTTVGGFLAQTNYYGGLPGLFALSSAVRLVALLPLYFVQEQRGRSLRQLCQAFLPTRLRPRTNET